MDLESLRERALVIAELYDRYNVAAGREPWSTADFATMTAGIEESLS